MICSCGERCSGKQCIDCYKKTFNIKIGKWEFASKKELDNIIKQQISISPRNQEFRNELFLTVINELHKDVKKRNFRCSNLKILDWDGQIGKWEFCRDRFRGGIFILGYFEPINEWHGVTLYPHRRGKDNVRKKLIDTLRQKWSEHAKKRDFNSVCESCGDKHPELHHDNTSFKEIIELCLPFFSEKELEEGIGDDWWLHETEADAVPNNHPAVLKMLELHRDVKYQWLCYQCHGREHETRI